MDSLHLSTFSIPVWADIHPNDEKLLRKNIQEPEPRPWCRITTLFCPRNLWSWSDKCTWVLFPKYWWVSQDDNAYHGRLYADTYWRIISIDYEGDK